MPNFKSRAIGATFALLAVLALPAAAEAGPVADSERALRNAYADYRTALFQTNAKNAEATRRALDGFSVKWTALSRVPAPPQYADDPDWTAMLARVAAFIKQAEDEVRKDRLAEAHDVLEKIRDEIGNLRLRNGLFSFSDRMNAFHEEMEHLLETRVDAATMGELRERAAVLAYLADQIGKYPAPEANAPDYAATLQALTNAVDALVQAVRTGNADMVRAAFANLKPAYSRMFIKFG